MDDRDELGWPCRRCGHDVAYHCGPTEAEMAHPCIGRASHGCTCPFFIGGR